MFTSDACIQGELGWQLQGESNPNIYLRDQSRPKNPTYQFLGPQVKLDIRMNMNMIKESHFQLLEVQERTYKVSPRQQTISGYSQVLHWTQKNSILKS